MEAEAVWQDVLEFLRDQEGLAFPADATAEGLARDNSPLCVTLAGKEKGEGLRTYLHYVQNRAILRWVAPLLETKKDSKRFYKLLRDSGTLALDFLRLSEPLLLASLRLGSPRSGPLLHCAQQVIFGVNEQAWEAMLREMRRAPLLRDKMQEALTGARLRWTPEEYRAVLCDEDEDEVEETDEDRDDEADTADDAPVRVNTPGGDSVRTKTVQQPESKKNFAECPRRVLEINQALQRGDLPKARLLASGRDIVDVPDEV